MDRIKILIVEDQILVRELLEEIIGKQPDMEIAGVAGDASRAPKLCRELKPDLALMDIVTENGSSGIKSAALIREEMPDIKIVLMTGYPEITFMEEAKKAGVHSYLYKKTPKEHLLYVIRSTMKGVNYYPSTDDVSPFARLFTDKEIEVINLVCQGMQRGEIARKLNMTEACIKKRISSILDKSGFDSVSQFAIYALSEGFIVPLKNNK